MRKKRVNMALLIGVFILIILLMIWLFLGAILEEDADQEIVCVTLNQAGVPIALLAGTPV